MTGARSIAPRLDASVIEPSVTITRSLGAERDLARFSVALKIDARRPRLAGLLAQAEIRDPRVQRETHAARVKPFVQRPDHGIVLVVDRPHDAFETVEARDHMGEAHEIALEFDRAVPGLKGEGRAPHEPEIGLEKRGVELIGDAGVGRASLPARAPGVRSSGYALSLRPNFGATSRCPSRTSRDFDEVFIVSFQSKISWVTVLLSSSVGIDENRSYVHRYLLSIIRPPRST